MTPKPKQLLAAAIAGGLPGTIALVALVAAGQLPLGAGLLAIAFRKSVV